MKRRRLDAQAARDAATLLPLAGTVLFLPPFILVFAAPVLVAGIPLIVIYLFSVWALIVLGAWFLARQVAEPDPTHIPVDADVETREQPERGHG